MYAIWMNEVFDSSLKLFASKQLNEIHNKLCDSSEIE